MTAEQVLGVASTLVDMTTTTQPASAPAPAAPIAPAIDVADDEYLTGASFRRAMEAATTNAGNVGVAMAADANVGIIRSQFAADFTKYGAEINALVAQVPVHLRTIDNLTRVVKMVRSDHVDEIAAERAQQLVSTMTPTLRPNGGGSAPAPVSREDSLESEKIPAEWKERARAAKITEDTVREFCYANGMTPRDFYKQFDTPMNKIVEDVSQRRHA